MSIYYSYSLDYKLNKLLILDQLCEINKLPKYIKKEFFIDYNDYFDKYKSKSNYNFSLYPDDTQPTGSVNLSRLPFEYKCLSDGTIIFRFTGSMSFNT